jgi:YggT family protein
VSVDFTTIIVNFVVILFRILSYAIIIRALMSWFPVAPTNPIVRLLDDVTEPILAPLRRIVPRLGMMDITPIVALVLLQVLGQVLVSGLGGA